MNVRSRIETDRRIFDRSGAVPMPPWRDRLSETRAVLGNLASLYAVAPAPADLPNGDGHAVLVLPGLFGSDYLIRGFRDAIAGLGYEVEGWGAGFNLGPTPGSWDSVERRLIAVAERSGRPVSLVGHSLGGILARALAVEHPVLVRQVVTVCSPFRLPTAMRFASLYWLLSYLRVDPEILLSRIAAPPPVPTTAIYAPRDGIVAWSSCIDRPGPGRENIAIDGHHATMMSNPQAIRVVAERLARPQAALD